MRNKLITTSLFVAVLTLSVNAQYNLNNFWNPTTSNAVIGLEKVQKTDAPASFLTYSINLNALKAAVLNAPSRSNFSGKSNVIVSFPLASGKIEQFRVLEASVMHPDLAAKYPEIKSYVGYGLNNRSLTVRFSLSPQKGLSAMIMSNDKRTSFIEPYTTDLSTYSVYTRSNEEVRTKTFNCLTDDVPNNIKKNMDKDANDQTLRTFRLAMSATGEYTTYHGGSKPAALAAINTTMTRVNGIYETDFAVTMVLIANTDNVIYTNAGADPYGSSLNSELQSTLTSVIGEANYDIGHLVHQETNSNGNAGCIGCVCVDGQKGSGFTSHVTPQGDNFDIDYVAHEMGHQFGANHTHTHNGFPESTGAQMEPGSGSTIMGYAGITGASDVQAHSDDYFHFFNIEQVTTYVSSTGCQTNTPIVNAVPVANAGNDYTIPHSTAFILEGSGTDADAGDTLSFCWEQGDEGFESTTSVNSAPNSGMSPSFRSQLPSASPNRYMPKLTSVISGNLTTQWETVQTQGGTMNFSLTVRDNVSGGGQNNIDKMVVTVDGASGPFEVTSQASPVTWALWSTQTITWNVANTTAAPVSTPNVDIYLSIDGGLTYPFTLATGVPNNGSANITVPGGSTTSAARVMVRGSGNIFYALNSTNFTISAPNGISELNDGSIKLYPNPTNGLINLEFSEPERIEKITLTDVRGRAVYQDQHLTVTTLKIDINHISNGIYSLNVQTKKGLRVYKVIKE